jgi:hypothetical protein
MIDAAPLFDSPFLTSLLDFTGHPEGLILNDDVHPDQWLITADGLVKFNDFSK